MSFTALVKSKVTLLKLFTFLVFYLLFFFSLGFLKTNIIHAKSISGVTPGAFVSENFRIEPTKEVTSNTVNLCLYAPEDNIIHTAGGIHDRLADSNEDNLVGKLLNNFIETESKKIANTLFVKTPDGRIPMNRALIQDITEGQYNFLPNSKKIAKSSLQENLSNGLIPLVYAGVGIQSNPDPDSKDVYHPEGDACRNDRQNQKCIESHTVCLFKGSPFGDLGCREECTKTELDKQKYVDCAEDYCNRNGDLQSCWFPFNDTYSEAKGCPDQKVTLKNGITVSCPGNPQYNCKTAYIEECQDQIEQAMLASSTKTIEGRCVQMTEQVFGKASDGCFVKDQVENELQNAVERSIELKLIEAERQKCKTVGLPDEICNDPNPAQKTAEYFKSAGGLAGAIAQGSRDQAIKEERDKCLVANPKNPEICEADNPAAKAAETIDSLNQQIASDRETFLNLKKMCFAITANQGCNSNDPAAVQKILEGHAGKAEEAQNAFDDLRKECYAISGGGDDACDSSNPVVVGNATYAYKKANEEAEFRKDCLAANIPVSICLAPRSEVFAQLNKDPEGQGSENLFASILISSCQDKIKALTAKGYGFDPSACEQLTPELIQTVIDTLPDANAITTALSSIGDCSRIGEGWFFDKATNVCLPPTFTNETAEGNNDVACAFSYGFGWSYDPDQGKCINRPSLLHTLGLAYTIGKQVSENGVQISYVGTTEEEINLLKNHCTALFNDPNNPICNNTSDIQALIELNSTKIKEMLANGEKLPAEISALIPSQTDDPTITPNPAPITDLPVDLDPKRTPAGKIRELCNNQSVACTAYLQPLNTRSDSIQEESLRTTSASDLAENLASTGNRVDREVSPEGGIEVVRYYDGDKPLSEYVYSDGQLVQVNSYYTDPEDHKVRSVVRYDAEECGGDGCRNYYLEAQDEAGNTLTSTTINEKVDGEVEVLTRHNNDQLELQVYEDEEELNVDLRDALGIEDSPIDLTQPNANDAIDASYFGDGEVTGGPVEIVEETAGEGDPSEALETTAEDYPNTHLQGFWCWNGSDWFVAYEWSECPEVEDFIPEEPQLELDGEYVEPEYTEPEYTDPADEETPVYEPEYEALPDSETDDSEYPYYFSDDEVLGVQSKRVVPSGKGGGVFCDMPLSEKIVKIEIENLDGGGSPKVFIEDPVALYDYSREGLAWQVAPLKANENQAIRNIKVTFYVRNNPQDKNLQTYSTNLTITLKKEGFIQNKISNPGSFLNNLRKLLPI